MMSDPIRTAENALALVLGAGRDSSGQLILDSEQESAVHNALAVVKNAALSVSGFTSGRPPESVKAAWLLIRHEHPDGDVMSVVLAVSEGEDWFESGDWKAESTLDSVHADGGCIVGWMPYTVPFSHLAKSLYSN